RRPSRSSTLSFRRSFSTLASAMSPGTGEPDQGNRRDRLSTGTRRNAYGTRTIVFHTSLRFLRTTTSIDGCELNEHQCWASLAKGQFSKSKELAFSTTRTQERT